MKRPFRQAGPLSPGPSFNTEKAPDRPWTLPSIFFAPEKAATIDVDHYASIEGMVGDEPSVVRDFFVFQCPLHTWMYFTQMLLMSSNPTQESRFNVFLNDQPVMPYQGTSDEAWPNSNNFLWPRLNTGFSNEHLRLCNLKLAPTDVLRVSAKNLSVGAAFFGVRFVGYDSQEQPETDPGQF